MLDVQIPYGAYWCSPFCRWQSSLAEIHAFDLAAATTRIALQSKPLPLEALDLGVLGVTIPQKGAFYGMPWLAAEIGAPQIAGPTIAQACATSARVIAQASAAIKLGEASSALTIATDRTSNGPHLYYPSPSGMGGAGAHEVWVLDNFEQDPFAKCAMIDTAENVAAEFDVTRSELDDVVLRRYEQYQDALSKDSAFQKRFMAAPLELTNKKGRVTARAEGDEGIRPVTREGLEALKPVRPEGVVTYGGQTHPADGAAGLIVTNAEMADEFSQDTNIAIRVVSFGQHRERVGYMPAAPIGASQKALDAAGLKIEQISAIKSHNPFAVNDVAFARAFDLDVMTMNNYGCSLIWGHPQGPTGLRAIIELIEELVLLGGGYGLFQGCAAGDSAMAVIIRVG